MGDPGVITRKERMKGETLPPMKWEFVDEEELAQKSKSNDPNVKIDYKRRRKSYRAKMTHLTRRSVIQEHRDMVNLRMQILAHDNHCNLIGDVISLFILYNRLVESLQRIHLKKLRKK